LLRVLPPPVEKYVRLFINITIAFMLSILFIFGVKLTLTMKMQKTAALGYSVSFVYLVLPLSAAIMLLHIFSKILGIFRKTTEERHKWQ